MANSNKIRHVLAAVIVLSSLYLAASLALKMYKGDKKEVPLPELPRNIDLSLHKIHYTETRDGVKKWDLFAEKGEYDKKVDVTKLSGVRLVFPGDAKSGEITLTSDNADYFNDKKDVKLYGNVLAKSVSGMQFATERASYEAARSLITSDDRVRYSDERLSLEGIGMELAVKTKDVKILKDVKATIRPVKKG